MKRTTPKPTPIRDAYAEAFPHDEILNVLGVRLLPRGKLCIEQSGIREQAAAVHHIFKLGGRHDEWANLVGVNEAGHDGRHNGTRGEGGPFTVLCLMVKFQKSITLMDPNEFNPFTLWKCAGRYMLPTVEFVRFEDEFLETSRRQLRDVLTEIESGRPRLESR